MAKVDAEVLRMLKDVAHALNASNVSYAIGGAVAMALYGVRRQTMDVDVFFPQEAKANALEAIRKIGYHIEPIGAPFLYAAYPPWETSDREIRVDLLFPEDDPELTAIQTAEAVEISEETTVPVFSPLMLTLSRLYSDQPRHLADLQMMFDRGLIPVKEVVLILQEHDPEMLTEFRRFLDKVTGPQKRRRPPKGLGGKK